MNWIFYFLINLTKFITLGVLLLLSVLAVPLVASIVLLGFALGYLREVEPQIVRNKSLNLSIPYLNANLFYPCSTSLVRVQHAWIQRHKSDY